MLLAFGASAKTSVPEDNPAAWANTLAASLQDSSGIIASYRVSGEFKLDIRDGKVYCENTPISFENNDFQNLVDSLKAAGKITTVKITAEENTPLGIISDIKDELRKADIPKVRYSSMEESIEYLPPIPHKTENGVEILEVHDIKANEGLKLAKRNLCPVRINAGGKFAIGQHYCGERPYEELEQEARRFILNPENSPKLPAKRHTDIKLPDGTIWNYPVSEAIFSLQTDRTTPYGIYIKVHKTLIKVYGDIRNEVAMKQFGKPLQDLSEAERSAVLKAVSMNISEAERPKTIR